VSTKHHFVVDSAGYMSVAKEERDMVSGTFAEVKLAATRQTCS